MITKQNIKSELELCMNIKNDVDNILGSLPEGNLYFKCEHGKSRPYMLQNGREKYLSRDKMPMINQMFRRKCMCETLRCVENNIELLKILYSQYVELQNVLPHDVGKRILERTDFDIDLNNVDLTVKAGGKYNHSIEEWLSLPRYENPYKPENKRHMTSAGVKVRSKEELIICTFLENRRIPYKYEERLVLEGNFVYPDFTIKRRSDGKIIIWEHFGMMDDPGYAERNRHKRFLYEKNGFLPYDNFIATYSEGRGSLDMTQLERIAEAMLL